MPARIPRLSIAFSRTLRRLGLAPGSAGRKAVLSTIGEIADADVLPGATDYETTFAPGRANVRRVRGANLWILYRFDATHVDALTVRTDPPIPFDGDDG